MTFELVTIFPHIFDSYISESILKRAIQKHLVRVRAHDLRTWAKGRHRQVDDRPYGGGVGMVMMAEPILKAVEHITSLSVPPDTKRSPVAKQKIGSKKFTPKRRVLLTSAKGKPITQIDLKRWTRYDQLVIICGRYEGVDERVTKFVDEEVSVGPYVVTGGELPALLIADGVSRLLPGVLGKDESSEHESHTVKGILEYPQFTRPEFFSPRRGERWRVPKILLSGNHKKIQEWREKKTKILKKR